MNLTDVGHLTSDGDTGEDKLEKGAKRDGISAWEVAKKYETEFFEGLKKLHIEPFDVMPRATDHITEQKAMVQTLIDKGYTYIIPEDGIYMDTSKVEDYGELMGPNYQKRLENLNAGERVEMGGKHHATDFALRKFSPKNEKRQMEREFFPYGMGFPGRHIECSAMSSKYLGQHFDLHHGGADHITVHHPNEIAQSECAFDIHGHPEHRRVKYRVHNEFLQVDGGKMSKSLGNVYTIQDLETKGYTPLDLRYFFFMAQYGNFQNFTRDSLAQAKKTRENLRKKTFQYTTDEVKKLFALIERSPYPSLSHFALNDEAKGAEKLIDQIEEAMKDNFNTPKLLSIVNNALSNPTPSELLLLYRLEKTLLKI
jgi:cysteinyl-tRNA synthetase